MAEEKAGEESAPVGIETESKDGNSGEGSTPIDAAATPDASSTTAEAKDETTPSADGATDQAADTDDTSSTGSDDSDVALSPSEDPMEMVIKAANHKEEGNGHFKKGDLDKAVRSYRKGTNLLKPLNKNNTGDEQVKALLLTLQNNLSMMFFKQNKIKVSRDMATKSLTIDSKNVKALYRRSVAHRKLGDLEKARDDLKEAVKYEPNNVAVRKEFAAVKQELTAFKDKQKKALAGAFSSSGASLYEDKEREKRRKEEEKKKQQEKKKEEEAKRKAEWEDECVKRMAKGEEAVSFDDWKKEREEAEKKKRKEEEENRKAERKARQAAKKKAAAAKADSDSEDEELTASELAMMRGYKKTADGRVTSYFTREQSAHEKELIGNITPQRLDSGSNSPVPIPSTGGDGNVQQKGRPSVWNQAGTWEEKDTTSWCTERLRERLLETKFSMQAKSMERYSAVISKVDSLTGDASVAITKGKKSYIFDYHVKLKFEIKDEDIDEVLADGNIHIPDICSTSHDELEVNFNGWKKSPASAHQASATECQEALISEIRTSVKRWVDDFNQHY